MLLPAAGSLVTSTHLGTPCQATKWRIVLRRMRCEAKTSSSRNTTGSTGSDSARAARSTASNATSDDARQPFINSTKRPAVVHNKSLQERVAALVRFLTPKQEGDAGDLFMISLSMAVLVYMSMQLYRLYAYAYFTMDHYQTVMDMMT